MRDFFQVCTPYTDQECAQEFDTQECSIVQEEKCEVVYQTQLEEQCENGEDETLCRDIVRNQCKTVNEEKCETR